MDSRGARERHSANSSASVCDHGLCADRSPPFARNNVPCSSQNHGGPGGSLKCRAAAGLEGLGSDTLGLILGRRSGRPQRAVLWSMSRSGPWRSTFSFTMVSHGPRIPPWIRCRGALLDVRGDGGPLGGPLFSAPVHPAPARANAPTLLHSDTRGADALSRAVSPRGARFCAAVRRGVLCRGRASWQSFGCRLCCGGSLVCPCSGV